MPIANSLLLQRQIQELQSLLTSLTQIQDIRGKLARLNSYPTVQKDLKYFHWVESHLPPLSQEEEYLIKSIASIGQAPFVFNHAGVEGNESELLSTLLQQLSTVETFYKYMGGIIGYHLTILSLILDHHSPPPPHPDRHLRYLHPPGIDLRENQPEIYTATRQGIEAIKQIGEIYPVGGAGDRLGLTDEKTGISLPAALLPFLGRTLLEGLIRDLQAREYLAFKLSGEQTTVPVVMMTSTEKQNHAHLTKICASNQWFGRPPDSFSFFIQPVVPVITVEGNWSLSAPLTLTLKPSGHGVIWKLAQEEGVFAWLKSKGKFHCLVRQINNPLASMDQAILALIGIGYSHQKAFGFISCERLVQSDEGINVLLEKQEAHRYSYCITNIEYPNLAQKGVEDVPAEPGSPFSTYPANTNILFANLSAIENALTLCPVPGQLINLKSKVPFIDSQGHLSWIPGGRLESTMQNIADSLTDDFPRRLSQEECKEALKTFIVYNGRSKTISTTKKSYHPEEATASTPEQAYYDLLSNHYSLLQQSEFELPLWTSLPEYLKEGPACLFLFHPALGPLYSIIRQKIRKGKMRPNAELQVEIAEIAIHHLTLEGSLLIEALSPLGKRDQTGLLKYGGESRCLLRHVTICNQGKEKNQPIQNYWKNQLIRKETVKVILHEGAEFHAEGITLEGAWTFEVPPYHRLALDSSSSIENWQNQLSVLEKPTWQWEYHFDSENRVCLELRDKESRL